MTSKIKVLIVEDEAITAMSLRMDLENYGIETLKPVATGQDAVKMALQEKPSLILMDIRLNGEMDGIEAATKIIKNLNIPIVFMTGYTTDKIKERAQKLNPLDFLEKPVNMQSIKLIIENLKSLPE